MNQPAAPADIIKRLEERVERLAAFNEILLRHLMSLQNFKDVTPQQTHGVVLAISNELFERRMGAMRF